MGRGWALSQIWLVQIYTPCKTDVCFKHSRHTSRGDASNRHGLGWGLRLAANSGLGLRTAKALDFCFGMVLGLSISFGLGARLGFGLRHGLGQRAGFGFWAYDMDWG